MIVNFYGEECFKIQSGELTILIDPFDASTGLTPPRLKPDILLKTLTSLPLPASSENYPAGQLILGPGEYNIKGVNIFGFLLPKESSDKFFKTVYLCKAEGINLCFLGHLSEMPEPAILEYLEEVDILFVPGGGSPFIDQTAAIKIIKQLEPKIVIPSLFKIPSLKRKAGDLKIFLEEFNHKEKLEPQEKLTIKKKDLIKIKKTEVICLKP